MIGKGTVAVVTGAGSGIGRAIVKQLARRSCSVALVDISASGLEETVNMLAGYPGKFSTHIVDVTSEEQIAALPEQVLKEHPHIDMIFNNAGITIDKPFTKHSPEDWKRVVDINLWGVIWGCYYFLPYLEQRPEAYIVNTSSLSGFLGIPTQSSYCVTKAAVKALNESLYAEYKSKNIHVVSVHPGAIKTNIFQTAIANSDNPEAATKMFSLVEKMAMDADKAAEKIIRATEKKKQRILVGLDARFIELIKRLIPVFIHKIFSRAYNLSSR